MKRVQVSQKRTKRPLSQNPPMFLDDPSHGIEATIIDLGLARITRSGSLGDKESFWTSLDDTVFDGEGMLIIFHPVAHKRLLISEYRRLSV